MKILVTGKHGLLATELNKNLEFTGAGYNDFDITDFAATQSFIQRLDPDLVVHLAAKTDVLLGDKQRDLYYDINVRGTANVAQCSKNLMYWSTEYVFDGTKGDYTEYDTPNPIQFYGQSKLLGEYEARRAGKTVVIRTAFKPRPYKHDKVPEGMMSTGGYVDDMAKEFILAITNFDRLPPILNIGLEKKSLFDLASETREVTTIKLSEVPVFLPKDASLDCSLWKQIKKTL